MRKQKIHRRKERVAARKRKRALRSTRIRLSVVPVPRFLAAERDSHRGEIHQAVRTAKAALLRRGTKVRLDFSKTKRIYPGGMLLLLAHLHLLSERYPGRITARCPPRSLAAQLMNHFGIAGRLGIADHCSRPTHDSVINWRHCTGQTADGEQISRLLENYREQTCADIPEGLYEALTEALTNVRHHAYDSGSSIPSNLQRWWLFARYDEPKNGNSGDLYVAVYDMGAGIPETMKKRLQGGEIALVKTDELFGWASQRPGKRLERQLLQRAVEHSRSSTGQDFRGKGLPEMREFVLKTKTGSLCIISGSAQYVCRSTSSQSTCTSEPTTGTLILWGIPLQPKEPS